MSTLQHERIMMISTHGYVASEPEFGKPDTGGQVVYVLELSKCLARMGYSVDILTRRFEDQPFIEQVCERARIVRIPCGSDQFIPKETLCELIPEWVENATRWIRQAGLAFRLIDSHYWDAGLAGQALSNRFGLPHVHTPHSIGSWKRDNMDGDPVELEKKYNFRKRIREEKVIYDECDLLIATTPTQRNILSDGVYDVPLEKIRVIPPGYDDQRFFPVSTSTRHVLKQQLGLEGPLVLALGRIAKNKGYDLLLQAMPPVFERMPESRLVLAVGSTAPNDGEIEMIRALQKQAVELGLIDRVVFKDYIQDGELADYYRAADVFALCSRYEPFGMTAIEAMACGTPTVVTTNGGLREMLDFGTQALYADPTIPREFAGMLAMPMRYPELAAKLSSEGSRFARRQFGWTGIAKRTAEVFEHFRGAYTPSDDNVFAAK
jgi:mannosylfructose-phosphate synthase